MSAQAPAGRRRRRWTWAAGIGVSAACAAAASVVPIDHSTSARAEAAGSSGIVCSNGTVGGDGHRDFALTATDGYTSEPDGNSIYGWGYAPSDTGKFQLPGPVLCVNLGETVDITLTNGLVVDTSIQLPGQEDVTADGNPAGPVADGSGNLTSLVPVAHPGSSITYSFTATHAGTYLYQSGTDPQLQVQMGLFGAIVVHTGIDVTPAEIKEIPADDTGTSYTASGTLTNGQAGMGDGEALAASSHAACAYASATDPTTCDPLAIYDTNRENVLILSEVDPGLHSFVEQHKTDPSRLTWEAYPTGYAAHYFMINGRSAPDTVAPNGAPWLPSQPYGSMAVVQPWDVHTNPLDALLRYVSVGVAGYSFHPHSNHEHVIAMDGSLLKGGDGGDATEEKFDIMVSSGATVDATFRWTNEEGYSSATGHRAPVQWPQSLNLTEGDFWSGSPYLGEGGQLNPGILSKTQCGEYYHVAHSHNLTQVTNYGITFGGMLTLIKVEPPAHVQGATVDGVRIPVCNG